MTHIVAALFIIFGVFTLGVVLQLSVARRPVLMSHWWIILFMMAIAVSVVSSVAGRANMPAKEVIAIIDILICTALSLLMPKGYRVIGVTISTFRGALYASLENLDLTFEDTISYSLLGVQRLKLIPGDITLLLQLSPWGNGSFWLRRGRDDLLLRGIADGMEDYFNKRRLGVHGGAILIELLRGALCLVLGIFFFSSRH